VLKTLPSNGSYSVPGGWRIADNGQAYFAGIPVVTSPLVAASKIWLFDSTRLGVAQCDAFNIRSSEFEGSNFTTNNITFRAECRSDLMVFQTQAIVYGNS
jgi:hypothetical protein